MKMGCLFCQKHLLWPRYKFPGVSQNCLYCSGCCSETRERTMHGTVWTVCLVCTVAHRNPRALLLLAFSVYLMLILKKYSLCKSHPANHTYMDNLVTYILSDQCTTNLQNPSHHAKLHFSSHPPAVHVLNFPSLSKTLLKILHCMYTPCFCCLHMAMDICVATTVGQM